MIRVYDAGGEARIKVGSCELWIRGESSEMDGSWGTRWEQHGNRPSLWASRISTREPSRRWMMSVSGECGTADIRIAEYGATIDDATAALTLRLVSMGLGAWVEMLGLVMAGGRAA